MSPIGNAALILQVLLKLLSKIRHESRVEHFLDSRNLVPGLAKSDEGCILHVPSFTPREVASGDGIYSGSVSLRVVNHFVNVKLISE